MIRIFSAQRSRFRRVCIGFKEWAHFSMSVKSFLSHSNLPYSIDELKSQLEECARDIDARLTNTSGDLKRNTDELRMYVSRERYLRAEILKQQDYPRQKRADILVPGSLPFTKSVLDCQNFIPSHVVDGCPREKLVNVTESIDIAFKYVESVVMENGISATGATRCSPIVYPRLARGGKGTFLRYLFDKLKEDGRFAPIIITFNGNFIRKPGESSREAIVRLIASQLIDIDKTYGFNAIYDEKSLLEHLEVGRDGKSIVLLIDELNQLGAPLDEDASTFLKMNFLDPLNRALVFTSHFVVDLEYFKKGPRPRGMHVVPMPFCKDMELLKRMGPHCEHLTPLQAVIYGYIPSMIYSFLNPFSHFTLETLVWNAPIKIIESKRKLVSGAFIQQCLDGKVLKPSQEKNQWLDMVRQFDIFGSKQTGDTIQFPIGYIANIFDRLNIVRGSRIASWFDHSLMNSESVGSGKDWEMVVQFAVLLRCADICFKGERALVNLFKLFGVRGITPSRRARRALQLETASIPYEVDSLSHARKWFVERSVTFDAPTLLIANPSHASFPSFDIFVALYRSPKKPPIVIGLQCTAQTTYPTKSSASVPDWIDKAILFQGEEPQDQHKEAAPVKWTFLTASQVQDFLGHSLAPLYPSAHLSDKQ